MAANDKAEFEDALKRILRVPKEALEAEERKWQEERRDKRHGHDKDA